MSLGTIQSYHPAKPVKPLSLPSNRIKMSDLNVRVGKLIREARKAQGLTQKELGDKLGISESLVSRYEKGKVNASLEALENIVSMLGGSLEVNIKI
jgi:UDP-N-acetylglucosamine 1-carboxyvinyltransferase